MIINDNGREYDTEYLERVAMIESEDRTSVERDIFNAGARFIYYRYTQIRDIINRNKCNNLTIEKVKQLLDVDRVQMFLPISEEEINYTISLLKDIYELNKYPLKIKSTFFRGAFNGRGERLKHFAN